MGNVCNYLSPRKQTMKILNLIQKENMYIFNFKEEKILMLIVILYIVDYKA